MDILDNCVKPIETLNLVNVVLTFFILSFFKLALFYHGASLSEIISILVLNLSYNGYYWSAWLLIRNRERRDENDHAESIDDHEQIEMSTIRVSCEECHPKCSRRSHLNVDWIGSK